MFFDEAIVTYESTCTTPQTSFNLGDTVCAKITGAPLGDFDRAARRVGWVSPYGSLTQGGDITTDPQTALYVIPNTQTQTFTDDGGGTVTVDNRGVWNVGIYSAADGSFREAASFTVHDPAKAFVDLYVSQGLANDEASVGAGSSSVFEIFVKNSGPDAAADLVISDTVPNNTSGQAITDHGSGFACGAVSGGVITCTLATLSAGATAHLTLNYSVDAGTPAGTNLTNVVSISSSAVPCAPDATCEINPSDNSSSATVTVSAAGGSGTCSLDCPDNVNAIADTTESGQRGTHVTFDAAEPSGTCGAVTATPSSGSFFPVGSTVVSVSSDTGGGSCSFVVTVEDQGANPPTISCPGNPPPANANGDCEAVVAVGTATATGNNVTVFGTRSDGKPMYTCDVNGTNCTRRSSDDPFSSGVTTITWIARSHDIPGPYADADTEEAHRTGAASCTETVTVNDTTPPVITATDSTVSADANCQAAVPDYTNSVSDNCACAANDGSQDCVGQHRITVTQDVPAGTMVGAGPHTIHLTANDGSSNNGGAGNTTTKDITFTVNDTTAPTITCPASITANTEAGTCSAHVNPGTATATDNCDSSPTIVGTRSDAQPLSATYPKGTTTITWTATDHASPANSSSCTQTITVQDHENPVISCPANITTGTDPNSCSATVNPGTPTASDNCGSATVAGVRSDAQALNAPYPKGTTTITWTATDSSGNHSSCNQTITVNDTQPPVISCTADIVTDFDPAVNGAVVTYTAPVGTDNCPGATTVQIAGLASGSTFPSGTTTNTFRVTDGAGLTASCSFKVTVALTSIVGLDSVTISGSGYADSYSSTGGYPASKTSLANILSNGTITIGGSGKVWGNVRSTRVNVNMTGSAQVTGNATAGTTVTTSGSASVGGTRTNNALAPVMTLPSVAPCSPFSSSSGITGTYTYNSSTGDLTLSGVNIATLANGNYCFHNITLGNSAQLKVNGPVVIKMTGVLNTSGATSLNNTTQIPSNMRILSSYSGSNGVILGNSTSVYAFVYSPNTGLNLSGSAPLFGTFAGKTLTIGNSGALHYDTQLKSIWPAVWALLP